MGKLNHKFKITNFKLCNFIMFILYTILIILIFPLVVLFVSSLIGIPCLPTHPQQARLMIELVNIKTGDKVVDLGAGHGRLLFLAAQKGAQAIGYELNPILVLWIWIKSKVARYPGKVIIRWQSLFKADVSEADTVFCFLFEGYMKRLEEKLFSQMKPGAKIIAYVFPFPNREYLSKEQGVFLYEIKKLPDTRTRELL